MSDKKKIHLFVPGRLCLFGEHSDWAGMYRTVNSDIEKGQAIVSGVEQGIYATAEKADRFDITLSFMSLLSMIRNQGYDAEQKENFGEIIVKRKLDTVTGKEQMDV